MNSKTTIKNDTLITQFFYKSTSLLFFFLLSTFFVSNTFAQTTWTGATSTDWFDATNWSDGVPDINDDVVIPTVANSPEINGTVANSKSVEVQESAALNITASGTLNIDGTSLQYSMFVLGTINNSGTIIIGNTGGGDFGIYLGIFQVTEKPGIFNNLPGSSLTINNTNTYGLWLANASGNLFANEGSVVIGDNASGTYGLYVENGVFNNLFGGSVDIKNNTNTYLFIASNGTFNNESNLDLGDPTGMTPNCLHGNVNYGTMSNSTDGTLNITSFDNRGLWNQSQGSAATFENSGTISIDGNFAGSYGLVVQNASSMFNNLEGGTIEVIETSTTGIAAGFGSTGFDETSVFNNNGTITVFGWPNNTSQGITANLGTFNNNAGEVTVYECFTGFSISSTGVINNSASLFFDTNATGSFNDIIRGPENGFVNNVGGSVAGNGEVEFFGPYTNNGGEFSPGDLSNTYGTIRFRNITDLSSATINLDINGNTTAGTDFDKIEIFSGGEETLTFGGTLNLNITYTPTVDVEYITILEAATISGEFSVVNGLPSDEWTVLYNFPSEGQVSLEYGAINSVQSGAFNDPNTWADGIIPDANTPAIVEDDHVVTLDANQTFEVARLEINDAATVVIPETSELVITNSLGTAIMNDGTIDMSGNININGSQYAGINNSGSIVMGGSVGSIAQINIINTSNGIALDNTGDFAINDYAMTNIEDALVGIVNTNMFAISEEGNLEIDFTDETAIVTQTGSTLTNNGTALIGRDAASSNSVGLYAIDHTGYIINSATGVMEIANATDTLILFTEPEVSTTSRNAIDGTVVNNGQMILFATQFSAVAQSDSATQVKGKSRHVLKKRPTPNPGRNTNTIASFENEPLALLRGNGIIESDLSLLNGGILAPGSIAGDEGIFVFDGDEDLQNITLEIDVNGKTLKGTDYDLIAAIGTITLGGDLNVNFNYTPVEGDVIPFIEATAIVGTFNNVTLPMDWSLLYNYPIVGNVSLGFGDALSLTENALNDLLIYNDSKTDQLIVSGTLLSDTVLELYDIQGRQILTQKLDIANVHNSINVSELSVGAYIVKLKSEFNGIRTDKLILN